MRLLNLFPSIDNVFSFQPVHEDHTYVEPRVSLVPPASAVAPAGGAAPEVVVDAQLPPPGSEAAPNFFADPGVLACKCCSCIYIYIYIYI